MKKAMKVMLGLVAVLVAFSMIGCGEPDLTPKYLFQKTATIDAADGTVTLEGTDVTWSIKGCDNGDTDPNNDLSKYDATGKIYLEGNIVKVVEGYNTNGENVVVRVFGTSTKDSYKYGWYDITLNIEGIEEKYWKIAVNNEASTTVVTSMKVNNVEQLTESKTVNDATMQAFWGSAAVIEAPEYFDIEILAENTPGTANWNNFAICMSNNIAATAWENTAILRADYYSAGWNPWSTFPSWLSKSTTNADAHVDIEGFDAGIINWDTFLADCTGNVKIKMTRTEESSAYIHFQIFVDPEKDGEYKNLFNALWVLADINAEGQPIPGVATEGGEGEVANVDYTADFLGIDFSDVITETDDKGNSKLTTEEALYDTALLVYSPKGGIRTRENINCLNYNGGTANAFAVTTVGETLEETLDRYVGLDISKLATSGNVTVSFSGTAARSEAGKDKLGQVVLVDNENIILAAATNISIDKTGTVEGVTEFTLTATVDAASVTKVVLGFSRGGVGKGGIDITSITATSAE